MCTTLAYSVTGIIVYNTGPVFYHYMGLTDRLPLQHKGHCPGVPSVYTTVTVTCNVYCAQCLVYTVNHARSDACSVFLAA